MGTPKVKAVILPHHVKDDGSVNIKIRITHNRKVKYLPTTEVARKGDYSKSYVITKNSLVRRLSTTVEELETIIAEKDALEYQLMDIQDVVDFIVSRKKAKEKFVLDFFEFGHEWASKKQKYSGTNYRCALNSFAKFLGTDSLDISAITSSLMRRYENHLHEKHGRDARAVSLYTSHLATIHSEARKIYNNEELDDVKIKNPFEYYKPPKQKVTKKVTLNRNAIQKLIDIRHSLPYYEKLAVDIFLLSFATMGSNVPDVYYAVMHEPGVIFYQRTKTKDRRADGAEMFIRLEPAAQKLFDEYKDPSGERAFTLHKMYTFYKSIADKGNDRLKKVAEMIGEKPFTMKTARRTFSTIANSMGIPKSLVNDMLCHVDQDMAVTDIYIEKDWSVLWEANRKVLESFDWK